MGRPEKELDDSAGPLPKFAQELRHMRRAVPGLTYRQMAKKVNYSPTVLSEAAAGRKLPTLEVTRAYVTACGGDDQKWSVRWQDVADELGETDDASPSQEGEHHPAVPAEPDDNEAVSRRRWPLSRKTGLVVATGPLVAIVAVVAFVIGQESGPNYQAPLPQGKPAAGAPPAGVRCAPNVPGVRVCFDERRDTFWVKDQSSDKRHAAVAWSTTHGRRGSCHNFLTAQGPWITCQQADALASARISLTFRAESVDDTKVHHSGNPVTVDLG